MSRCDEYCDNHGCNRGPNCYGRADCADIHCPGHPGAKVARIGRRDYAKEAYPPSVWRLYLRHLAKWMLICILMLLAGATIVGVLHA